jgi:hypothetical protein
MDEDQHQSWRKTSNVSKAISDVMKCAARKTTAESDLADDPAELPYAMKPAK